MTHAEHPENNEKIVEVYSAANEVDAGAVRAALEDQGIRAQLVGDLAGNAFDIPLGVSAPKIWVFEKDATAARLIIEQLEDRLGEGEGRDASLVDDIEPDDG